MARTWKAVFVGLMAAALAACHQPNPQPIDIAGVKNVTRDGDVYIAGAPTTEGLREMKSRGVTTIIDLRGEQEGAAEERAHAKSLGLHYIHIPMKSDQMTPEQAKAVVDGFEKHKGEKILLHCAGGNRAGAAYGAYLGVSGKCTGEQALRAAEKAGLKNEHLKAQTKARIEETQGR
ncbi:MAG: tyrosine-protein phosphatase [Planctomycetes bacterium]|nr:tyrosine-protein phosphatase [Planctomycetota bacterium]